LPLSRPTEFFLLLDIRQKTWTILEFINPNESKRAKKMLELALSQVFSGLDESKKSDKPKLDLS
jgi:type IV secretory pathway TraG/TraD family ATPase VirD4